MLPNLTKDNLYFKFFQGLVTPAQYWHDPKQADLYVKSQ